jgi:hypothetical protein
MIDMSAGCSTIRAHGVSQRISDITWWRHVSRAVVSITLGLGEFGMFMQIDGVSTSSTVPLAIDTHHSPTCDRVRKLLLVPSRGVGDVESVESCPFHSDFLMRIYARSI